MREYFMAAVLYVIISVMIVSYWAIKIRPEKVVVQNPTVSELMPSANSEDHE